MAVVVDANLLVVLALDRTKAGAVEERLRAWRAAGESLHAPSLLAGALTRAVDAGQLAESDVELAWRATTAAPIRLHELETGPAVIEVARQLGRRSAYDAARSRPDTRRRALDARRGRLPQRGRDSAAGQARRAGVALSRTEPAGAAVTAARRPSTTRVDAIRDRPRPADARARARPGEPAADGREVSQILRVPRSTVYELAHTRRVPFLKVGRRTLFEPELLMQWIAQLTVRPR